MTQGDRDRLVALRKARKKLIAQQEAAEELGLSVRQVKRLLRRLPSKRRIAEKIQQKAVRILSGEDHRGFGPTLASEYLASQHKIVASRETVRKWMTTAGL